MPNWIVPVIIMAGITWALMSRMFSRSAEIETITNKIVGGFSLLIYPGFFIFWLVKITGWENPGAIALFLFISCVNDSGGWLFGTLFGKNNRGLITISPNKSIAGYLGGLFGSVLVVVLAVYFFPMVYSTTAATSALLPLAIIIGTCTGIAASLGDLTESAIKRSCGCDDSGNFMLGRGGVLDSIDSIAVAAPVFYMLYYFFFIS
jgi:phosphatidate cytidylyltransferase